MESHFGLCCRMVAANRIRELEEGREGRLDFGRAKAAGKIDRDVLPVVVQDADTREVLFQAYADRRAVRYSLQNRVAAFWSITRNQRWIKGKKSGNTLTVVEVRSNCEQNSLLYLVRRTKGGACHTKNPDGSYRPNCYYRRVKVTSQKEFRLEPVADIE